MQRIGFIAVFAAGLLLLATSPSDAQDLEAFASRAPSAQEHPQDDALVLYEEVAWTLHADGRVDRYTRHIRKYFTPYEVNAESDPRIPFDSATQTLDILSWRTVMASGRVVEKKDRSFNQVTPDALGRAPDYATVQEMVSTHLGMEEGAVVEREYAVRDIVDRGEGFSGIEFFPSRLPVLEKVLRVTVPRGTDLRFRAMAGTPSYKEEKGGGTVTHIWRMENLAAVAPGSVDGFERECLPHVVFSSVGSWEELAEDCNSRIEACVRPTERMRRALEDVVREAQGEPDLVRLIHEAVCEGVRGVEYVFPLVGTQCRPAGAVYETGYGHRLDRAVLLLSWLREAGVEAEPVLVSASSSFAEEVPAIEQTPEVWVVAWTDDRPLWMDPLHPLRSASYKDLEGRTFVRIASGAGLDVVPDRGAEENLSSMKLTARVKEDGGMDGEVRVRLTGAFSPYFDVSGVGDECKEYVEGLASGLFGGVEVKAYNLLELTDDAVALGFSFEKAPAEEGLSRPLALPGTIEEPEISGFQPAVYERQTALVLSGAYRTEVEAILDLWDGARVERIPEAVTIEAPFGSYHARCLREDATIRFSSRMEIGRSRIEPEEYPQFRRMVLADRNGVHRSLVLGSE